MARFVRWRVRRASAIGRFSDGLVLQGGLPGELALSVCRVAGARASLEELPLLSTLVAACTSEGIRRDTGIVSWLHWPNLVTVDGRVVAKSTLAAATRPGKTQLVFGVSVNCFAAVPAASRSELRETSILEALGVEVDLDLLRDKILHALEWYYAEWERGMNRKLVERIRPTIAWLGRDVEVRAPGHEVIRGRAQGLDEHGSLLLSQRQGDGTTSTRALTAEGVELVREVK